MEFPAYSHLKITAPGIGMTNGQMENLYMIYNEAVLNKTIKPLPNNYKYQRDTYFFLKEKSGYEGKIIIAFMEALITYANSRQTEKWKNPIYREKREEQTSEAITDFFTKPVEVITSTVAKATKTIIDPITKPLIAVAVIVGVGGVVYVGAKAGLFQGIAKAIKKRK